MTETKMLSQAEWMSQADITSPFFTILRVGVSLFLFQFLIISMVDINIIRNLF